MEGMMSDAAKKRIEAEILATLDRLITGCETLDMELAFRPFSRSPEVRMIAADGSLCDLATYYSNNVSYLATCSAFAVTTLETEVRVLRSDLGVLSWIYKPEATLETGERDVIDRAGASFVFEKREAAWEVIHYHESSLPPIRRPPGA
jgi:hypothetical protein